MMRYVATALGCALLAACARPAGTAPLPALPGSSMRSRPPVQTASLKNALPQAPEVLPVRHVATVSLLAKINPGNEMPAFYYNGQPNTAPTIRVDPGDAIVIDVANELPGPTRRGDMNLHFHGLTVSPNPPADDVVTTLALPGGTLHYVIQIPPTQEPGLYWYHPHVFPMTDFQVGEAGMSGAIVVNGLQRHFPALRKMNERVLMVRDIGAGDSDMRQQMRPLPHVRGNGACSPDPGLTLTVNGAVRPAISIAPSERQFFRLANATGHKTLKIAVDGGTLHEVAVDGFALDVYPGTTPRRVSSIVVPPSARAEFVVTGPAGGEAKLRTLCYDSGPGGDPDPEEVLAVLRATAGRHAAASPAPAALSVGEPLPANAYSRPLPPPSMERTVVLSEDDRHMYVNGKAFKMMDAPMFVAHAGTVEKWTVQNVTDEVHDFHIHQVHYVVKAIDGRKLQHPYWADSVVVPPEKNGVPGTLTLLVDFRDPVVRGTFMFHCHILDHEDRGMMAKIEVV
jgi:suppressor of ftsI